MGFTVNFYKFSKKVNSTARPGDPNASYTCRIKEPCGVFNPVIGLDLGLSDSPREYNYAYIPTFDRYYFVREWTFQNGLWYATLEVDALASWKNGIGESTCYVLRSSQSHDLDIVDTTYPGTNKTTTLDQQVASYWVTDSIENGMFIVGIAGQSTTYYLFYKDALDVFFDWLFSDLYIDALIGTWSTVFPQAKATANPIQFITSIMWIPFQTSGTSVNTIRVGFVNVPCVADRVDGSGIRAGTDTFTINRHPQAARGNYLNNSPFTSYTLFYPPWGTIPLDPDIMANSETLYITWLVDLRTGQGTLALTGGSALTHYMSWTHTQVGLNYQVSQVLNKGFGVGNLLAPLISTGAAVLTGNYAGAAASGIAGGAAAIGNAAMSKIPSATTIGSNGGMDSLRGTPTLQYEFKEIVDEDLDHRGRPLCTNKRIDTLSGYIMVKDADISLPATKQEQEAIRTHMEGGFFYE
jgi:hypothetical protein